MFINESCNSIYIKKLNKYLCKIEGQFLNRLYFWSSHKNEYGIERDGMVWIYNTLDQWAEQLNVSKSSMRRAIKSLRDKGIISSAYLAANKRNRTLYYAINYDVLEKFIPSAKRRTCAQNGINNKHINEHMVEHMYNTYTYTELNKSNKSNKSKKNSKKDSSEQSVSISENKPFSPTSDNKPKNSTAQNMLAIWNEEMNKNDSLNVHTARYLVAAIQLKFENSLELWKKYLKRIKTSAYLMGEKFNLWLSWVLKFSTIDQILAGGFSTKEPEKPLEDQKAEAEAHIASLDEEPECLQIRRNFIKYHGPSYYMTWLAKATLRKITVQYHNRQEELLAVAVESKFAFERLRMQYLESYVTGGLSVDSDNHFQKQENKTEQVKQAEQKQSVVEEKAIAEAKAEAHIASLSEEPECLQIRRNFVEQHGPSFYMAWLAEATLRKITLQYQNRREELLAISVESDFVFHHLRACQLVSCVTGGLKVDNRNHFPKQKNKTEQLEQTVQKQSVEEEMAKAQAEAEAHIASLSEELECLQIRRNFIKYHGPILYMAWLTNVTMRKITVQYRHCSKERIAVSMEIGELFEYLITRYMGSCITDGLEIDDKNHFQKPELLAEKITPEITKQEQPETATDDWKSEYESQMQGNNLSAIYPGFSEEIDNSSGEYEPSMQFVQPWPRREGENSPTLAHGINQKQPIASVEDCCAMLIQNLSSKRPPLVNGGA